MAVTLRDSCDASGLVYSIPQYTTILGQTITPSEDYKLERIDFYAAWKYGDPGTCYISLQEVSGGYPTGDLLTEKAAFTVTADRTLKSVTFSTQPNLESGTTYAIVWEAPNGVQDSNELNVDGFLGTGEEYTDGVRVYYWSTWYTNANQDMGFYCYGSDPLPGKATNPTPADEESGIALHSTTVTWESGGNTDSYNIYFGTLSGFLSLVAEGVTELEATLVTGNFTNYGFPQYWRVDAVNDAGITQGDEWYLTTILFDTIIPTGMSLVDGELTGTPTGENNMITVRRLVAAANSKVWYEDL